MLILKEISFFLVNIEINYKKAYLACKFREILKMDNFVSLKLKYLGLGVSILHFLKMFVVKFPTGIGFTEKNGLP